MKFSEYAPFISEMTGHLAWPLAAALGFALAYKLLRIKLPPIKSVKYGDWEMDTHTQDLQATSALSNTALPSNLNKRIGSENLKVNIDYVNKVFDELKEAAKKSKFYAINQGNLMVNDALRLVGKTVGAIYETRDDLLNKFLSEKMPNSDEAIFKERHVRQIKGVGQLYDDLMRYEEEDDIPTKQLDNYFYLCAVNISLIEDTLEQVKGGKKA